MTTSQSTTGVEERKRNARGHRVDCLCVLCCEDRDAAEQRSHTVRGAPISVGDVLAYWFDQGAGATGGPALIYARVLKVGRKLIQVRSENASSPHWVRAAVFDHKCTDAEIVAQVCAKVPL